MTIRPIEDGNSLFELVYLFTSSEDVVAPPHCRNHGAMNKVSVFKDGIQGYWRCNVAEGLICRARCTQTLR